MSIQALREQRAIDAKQLHTLANKTDYNPATDNGTFDALSDKIAATDERIKRIETANTLHVETVLAETVIDRAEKVGHDKKNPAAKAFAKFLRGGVSALTADENRAVFNTMSTTTGSEGGFTVQTDVATSVVDLLKAFGGMRDAATVIRTAQGNPQSWPTSDGTSETGEQVAENVAAAAADLVFGTVAVNCYKFSSRTVAVPIELLQDSVVDIEAFVMNRLVTRLGRIMNTRFTLGTGSSQPNGLITASATGVTAANTTSQVTAIIYDSLVNLVHSVDPAYRANGAGKFMMNDATIGVIRKIKDGQSRPIFVPGYESTVPGASGSAPNTLLGHEIIVNQDVAVMAAGAKSVAFGDFSKYLIRDALDVEMQRYTDSVYASKGQVGFQAWARAGGNLLDVGAVKLFVNAAS